MACVPNYGQQIRKVRKAFHLTQQEMAGKAGIGVNSLRRYEVGERQPNMAVLSKLAEAVGLSVAEFLWNDPITKEPYRTDEQQEFDAFSGYLQEMGYTVRLDMERFDNPEGKNGPVWVIDDEHSHTRYTATAAQLDSLMQNVIAYTKFQINQLLSTLDPISPYQKKE